MKLVTKLVLLGSVIAAAGILVVFFRRNRLEHNRPPRVATVNVDLGHPLDPYDPGDELVADATVIATDSGIAGGDLDRLPRPGKRI